jgi:hypothetical protein
VGKVYLPDPRSFPNHASDQNGGHDCRHVAIENKQNGGREPGEFNDVTEKENQNGGQQTGKDLENNDMEQDEGKSSDFPVASPQSSGKKIKARLDIEKKEEDEEKLKKNGQDNMKARLQDNMERKKQDKKNGKEETEEEKVEKEKVEEEKVEEEKVEEEKVEEKKVEEVNKSVDCGAPCKFCLFLVSGHTKVILAFKDKATLMVSLC